MSVELVDLVSQFRMMIYQHFPYLAPYIYSLTPVERPGLGTMAVDKYGRMYYDPAWCETLTLEQGGYVVCHEGWHLILRHCHRSKSIVGDNPSPQDLMDLNIAYDIVVWELMEAIKDMAPEGGVTLPKAQEKWPEITPNMLPEQLYSIISSSRKKPPVGPGDGEDGELGGNGFGPKTSHPSDEKPEENEQQEEEKNDGGNGEQESSDGDQEKDGKGRGQDSDGEQEAESSGDGDSDEVNDHGFNPIGGGSGADGQPRDYEEEPDPNWDAFKEDRLLESIEKKIEELEEDREWQAGRGTIPAELKRLIKQKLRPQPNPWDRLRATVAKCAANHRGCPDYTYRKMSRRQQAFPEMPRLKGVQKYSPKAVVIVDTSGSMTPRCLAKALTVIKQGLQALGQVPVVTCDAKVHQDKVLSAVHDEFELVGGGGTDMRVPIDYTQQKYRPDVTVLVTDTGTPWPSEPIKGQLIVAATQDGHVPHWATKVRIPDSPEKNSLEDDE